MQPASLRTVSLGGTKRKLMNWKGTQRYQLVTTTLAQSCCSFALTAPAPFSAVVSLERGGEGGGSEWRDEPVSMHWHASLDAQGEDACQEGGAKSSWSTATLVTATIAPWPWTRRPSVLYLRGAAHNV